MGEIRIERKWGPALAVDLAGGEIRIWPDDEDASIYDTISIGGAQEAEALAKALMAKARELRKAEKAQR